MNLMPPFIAYEDRKSPQWEEMIVTDSNYRKIKFKHWVIYVNEFQRLVDE